MTQQEEQEAAAFIRRHARESLLDVALRSYQKARDTRPIVSDFALRCLQPLWATFRGQYSACTTKLAQADFCVRTIREFERLAALPVGVKEGMTATAAMSAAAAVAPLPPIFDAANFCARLASQGISLTVGPSGEILARGRLDPTARQIITHPPNKVAIVAYLQTPAQVVA